MIIKYKTEYIYIIHFYHVDDLRAHENLIYISKLRIGMYSRSGSSGRIQRSLIEKSVGSMPRRLEVQILPL